MPKPAIRTNREPPHSSRAQPAIPSGLEVARSRRWQRPSKVARKQNEVTNRNCQRTTQRMRCRARFCLPVSEIISIQ
jgi:hypothetical protein